MTCRGIDEEVHHGVEHTLQVGTFGDRADHRVERLGLDRLTSSHRLQHRQIMWDAYMIHTLRVASGP